MSPRHDFSLLATQSETTMKENAHCMKASRHNRRDCIIPHEVPDKFLGRDVYQISLVYARNYRYVRKDNHVPNRRFHTHPRPGGGCGHLSNTVILPLSTSFISACTGSSSNTLYSPGYSTVFPLSSTLARVPSVSAILAFFV
jgi:hypothetical protein